MTATIKPGLCGTTRPALTMHLELGIQVLAKYVVETERADSIFFEAAISVFASLRYAGQIFEGKLSELLVANALPVWARMLGPLASRVVFGFAVDSIHVGTLTLTTGAQR